MFLGYGIYLFTGLNTFGGLLTASFLRVGIHSTCNSCNSSKNCILLSGYLGLLEEILQQELGGPWFSVSHSLLKARH